MMKKIFYHIILCCTAISPLCYQSIHGGNGGGIAAGVFGGMVAGSLLTNAMNQNQGPTTVVVERPTPYYAEQTYRRDRRYQDDRTMPDEEMYDLRREMRSLKGYVRQMDNRYHHLTNEYNKMRMRYKETLSELDNYRKLYKKQSPAQDGE